MELKGCSYLTHRSLLDVNISRLVRGVDTPLKMACPG